MMAIRIFQINEKRNKFINVKDANNNHKNDQTLTGKTITLDVEPNDTIQNKQEYLQNNNIYFFVGKKLGNDRSLNNYNIQK